MATPNMNLTLPTPSVTVGPGWATTLNAALTTVDSHNHTSGQGVQVPTAGINVNLDLPFNGFNATLLRSARFSSQAAPLALGTDANCVYVSGGNLYYNNGSGAAVQITSGTALSATSLGGISGLAATTGSAAYSSVSGTFTWSSNTNVAATMDSGPHVIRDTATSALGITLKSPAGLAGAYSLTFPSALPGANTLLAISSTGALSAPTGSTISAGNNTIQNVGTPSVSTDAVTKGYVDTTFTAATHTWSAAQTFSGGITLGSAALFAPAAAFMRMSALEGDSQPTLTLSADTKFGSFVGGRAVTVGAMTNDGVGRITVTNTGTYRIAIYFTVNTGSITSSISIVLKMARNGAVAAVLADGGKVLGSATEDLPFSGETLIALNGGDFVEAFYNAAGGGAGNTFMKYAQMIVQRVG